MKRHQNVLCLYLYAWIDLDDVATPSADVEVVDLLSLQIIRPPLNLQSNDPSTSVRLASVPVTLSFLWLHMLCAT